MTPQVTNVKTYEYTREATEIITNNKSTLNICRRTYKTYRDRYINKDY